MMGLWVWALATLWMQGWQCQEDAEDPGVPEGRVRCGIGMRMEMVVMAPVLLWLPWARGNERAPPNARTPSAPMVWFGGAGWSKGRVPAARAPRFAPLRVPPPWHSQAIGEVLHERAQAGEGEDGQDSEGQLE